MKLLNVSDKITQKSVVTLHEITVRNLIWWLKYAQKSFTIVPFKHFPIFIIIVLKYFPFLKTSAKPQYSQWFLAKDLAFHFTEKMPSDVYWNNFLTSNLKRLYLHLDTQTHYTHMFYLYMNTIYICFIHAAFSLIL